MSDKKKLKLVLCWHMHQPEYRDLKTGEFKLPWTYLHVIKDYIDMVAHLENEPNAKAVINFTPTLLEQIDEYAKQVTACLQNNCPIKDALLNALMAPNFSFDNEKKLDLIESCLRANKERQINRYPIFNRLVSIAGWVKEEPTRIQYINDQFIKDLLVWYHLAWMAESVKLTNKRIQYLINKGESYTLDDRKELMSIIGSLLTGVIKRYKDLSKKRKIELSMTPYAHPIMPLMLDLNSAKEAIPDMDLPKLEHYSNGEERIKWHFKKGIATFKHFFGETPKGCWPSEGAISKETLSLLDEFNFSWTATGGNVLNHSLDASHLGNETRTHHPYQIEGTKIPCFFRDDGLSDLIGFEYSKWHGDDAVGDFIHHLENIAEHESDNSVVSIIMDGENAWEHFPDNGYHFLSALYKKLTEHSFIELTTFSDCLAEKIEVKNLPTLISGSWVYGTFSTWIGDKDKNRGWDMLGDIKKAFDHAMRTKKFSKPQLDKIEQQLAICEGSDWFWWFGDYNPGEAVSDFETLFRLNLTNLYDLLAEEVPDYLTIAFTQGSGEPAMGGTMRKGSI